MMVDTKALIAVIGANQNFSRVMHIVDENGLAVIPKNNKPRYIVIDLEEYKAVKGIREVKERELEMTTSALIEENMGAFLELVK